MMTVKKHFPFFSTIEAKNYFILTFLWLLIEIIINPIGEFPLNDDWAYCRDVFVLTNQGHMEFVGGSAMTLVSQILMGSFFCKILGFSFTLLRILTSAVALTGILVSYRILRDLDINRKTALFLTLLIMCNPLFVSLSNTFMTDIYFFTFSIISIYFFNRSFINSKTTDLLLATVCIIVATLVRQIGIIIPVSFALVFVLKAKSVNRSLLIKVAFPFVLTAISLALFHSWLSVSAKEVTGYFSMGSIFSNLGIKTASHFFFRSGSAGMTLGLLLFPLLILQVPHFSRNIMKRESRLSVVFTLIFTIPMIRAWMDIPFGNVFYNLGAGPKLLRDAGILHLNNGPVLNDTGLTMLRLTCLTGGILLYFYLFRYLFNILGYAKETPIHKNEKFRLFSIIIAALFFCTFLIPDFFFDRYLIQLIFPFILVILPAGFDLRLRNRMAVAGFSVVFLFIALSVGFTHDYLAWNRARWQGLDYLMTDQRKSPHVIDGGLEFNAWYQTAPSQDNESISWWFVDGNDYLLTFGPLAGYSTVKLFPYRQYIPFEEKQIHVLKKGPD
jgi:hypothetical protein